MAQDITDSKRAERALRENEQNLTAELARMKRLQEVSTRLVQTGDSTSLLLEIVDTAISVTAADMGNIQLLDPATGALKIVASRGFENPFLEYFDLVHGDQAACGTAMQRHERVVVEDVLDSPVFSGTPALEVVLAAGVRTVQSTPLVGRAGQLVGMLSTHYRAVRRPVERDLGMLDLLARQAADWIERSQAEHALRDSEERYRSLISQVREFAIFSTDGRGIVTTWNEGCQHVFGFGEAEFVGLDTAELFTPEHRAEGLPALERREAVESGTARIDRWMMASGGRRFFGMGATAALRDTDGRLIGFSTVIRDLTQMRLVQEELAHHGETLERLVTERTDQLEKTTERLRLSERMASLGTLAAGLGHDMGNLLLPLDIRLDLLLQADLPRELHEHVVGIQKCARYLQRLSSGLRLLATDPSSPRTGEVTELRTWWDDIGLILKDVLPRSVRLEHELPAGECWVAIGRTGLTQAVFNLVQNAADALKERGYGKIRMAAEDDPAADWVTVRVTDDGPGMTDEVARRCLEPYFSTKPRGESTGLGLAFVHGLVTGPGGRVEIDSRLGEGTSVSLLLLRAPARRAVDLRPGGKGKRSRMPRAPAP